MPYAPITNESLLMGQLGWACAGTQPKSPAVLGADRHGKIVARNICIKSLGFADAAVFLGTESSFGVFAAETPLVDRAGRCLTAQALAESNDLADVWFENVMAFSAGTPRADLALFAAALMKLAPFVAARRFARRCTSRDAGISDPLLKKFCKLHKVSNEVFLIVDNGLFETTIGQEWDLIIHLVVAICGVTEDESLSFEVGDDALAAWFCSALATKREHYKVGYDSLQHSLFAKVQRTKERQSPFKNARCGYLERRPCECLKIDWEDPSWSPIVNGFLIKGL
jgi:hypothetical protein